MPTSFGTSTIADYIYSIHCIYGGEVKSESILQGIVSDNMDEDEKHFLVYPNPTTGKVTVTWSQGYERGLILSLFTEFKSVKCLYVLAIEVKRND